MPNSSEMSGRALSLVERYSLARENMGFPQHITTIVTYPDVTSLPSAKHLSKRIEQLQIAYPGLSITVIDRYTSHPAYRIRGTPWSARDILRDVQLDQSLLIEEVLRREIGRMRKADMSKSPFWQVTRYLTPSGPAYITITISHVLGDGTSMQRITTAILGNKELPSTPQDLPVHSNPDDTITQKPGAEYLIPVIYKALVLPRLPSFLQGYLRPTPPWPGSAISRSLIDCPEDLLYTNTPATLVTQIKMTAKTHCLTLHPILKLAYMIAMWDILSPEHKDLYMSAISPKNERSKGLGHPYLTGSYVIGIKIPLTITSRTSFWQTARSISQTIASPAAQSLAKQDIGSLAYIPDPKDFAAMENRPTGWEAFFLDNAESEIPLGQSMELSNLGVVELPPGAIDIAWVQPASPVGAGINLAAMGHAGGVRIVATWREGGCVTREQVIQIERVFLRVLEGLVDGKQTAEDLVRL